VARWGDFFGVLCKGAIAFPMRWSHGGSSNVTMNKVVSICGGSVKWFKVQEGGSWFLHFLVSRFWVSRTVVSISISFMAVGLNRRGGVLRSSQI